LPENGLWELSVKKDNRYVSWYVRRDGASSANYKDLRAPEVPQPIGDLPNTGLAVHPTIRERIGGMPLFFFPQFYQTATKGYYLLEDQHPESGRKKLVVYNHLYEPLELQLPGGTAYQNLEIRAQYLLIEKITSAGDRSFQFFDLETLEPGLEVSQMPYNTHIDGDLLFYQTKGIFDQITVHKIAKLDGQVIYEPSAAATVFKDIASAKIYVPQVRELHLTNIPFFDLLSLTSFPDLEVLMIDQGHGLRLPAEAFGSLTKLRSLRIKNCADLESLPLELQNLSSLEILYIQDCPNLKAMDIFLQKATALRLLRSDLRFTPAQRERLQATHPQLVIEELLAVQGE